MGESDGEQSLSSLDFDKAASKLFKDWMEDLKDPLFLFLGSFSKESYIIPTGSRRRHPGKFTQ